MNIKDAIQILQNDEQGDLTDIYTIVDQCFDGINLGCEEGEEHEKRLAAQNVFLGWILKNIKLPE